MKTGTKEENPLVSIIVRTKDRPKLLRNALRSISAQTYRPIEVVLVNDGGCDLEIGTLKDILGDVSLNYVRLKENAGRAHAANLGIEDAQGKYVGFLDDDDELYPEHVATLANSMRRGEYAVLYSDSEIVEFRYDEEIQDYKVEDRYVLFSEDYSYERLLLGNFIPLMCLLFDRKVLRDSSFDETFDLYEDWDLLIRLAKQYPFHHIKEVTAKYNQNLVKQITADSNAYRHAFIKLMEKHMNEITPDVLFYNWQMIIDGRELIKGSDESKENIRTLKRATERKIEKMAKMIEAKEILINNMKSTLGWQMLESFRGFRDRLLPFGSKRRYYFELMVKSMKVLRTQGFNAFYYKARGRFQGAKHINSRVARRANVRSGGALLDKPVDIILPVYNAYDDLTACMRSILGTTDLVTHRLIVVDDKSSDPRVKDYLQSLAAGAGGKHIVTLYNENNLGFTQTVNRGMKFSDRDVILLNSDTIVTTGWVEKLRAAAYSGPKVATATPFSNNATICSVPNMCENNALPEPFDLDSFAEFIDRISLRYYPEIPTGVGFCMYIKREVLNEVGYFDEAVFERGYGEENDFCVRAMKNGFTHVIDDATFIYHKGGASFTSEMKMAGENEALKILDKIHPEYRPMVNRFIQSNPLKEIQSYIRMRIDIERGKGCPAEYQTSLEFE